MNDVVHLSFTHLLVRPLPLSDLGWSTSKPTKQEWAKNNPDGLDEGYGVRGWSGRSRAVQAEGAHQTGGATGYGGGGTERLYIM